MANTEGNGHTSKVYPITDEALNAFAAQLHGILVQALREALDTRKDKLIGEGKTVAELVANIDDVTFRTTLSEHLLSLKIEVLLTGLRRPPLDIVTEAEYQEIKDYLLQMKQRAQLPPDNPSA